MLFTSWLEPHLIQCSYASPRTPSCFSLVSCIVWGSCLAPCCARLYCSHNQRREWLCWLFAMILFVGLNANLDMVWELFYKFKPLNKHEKQLFDIFALKFSHYEYANEIYIYQELIFEAVPWTTNSFFLWKGNLEAYFTLLEKINFSRCTSAYSVLFEMVNWTWCHIWLWKMAWM